MDKPKMMLIVLSAAILIAIIGLYLGERPKPEEEVKGEFTVLLVGENIVEISGKAKDFVQLDNAPFFSFFIDTNQGRFQITGCDESIFMSAVISPTFTDVEIEWKTEPLVWVLGRIRTTGGLVGPIVAYIIDENVEGQMQNWYYKSFLTKEEREKMKWMYVMHGEEKPIWLHGTLTVDDLLWYVIKTENGEHFSMPDSYLGNEAYIYGILKSEPDGGLYIRAREIYVKQEDTYIRIYP